MSLSNRLLSAGLIFAALLLLASCGGAGSGGDAVELVVTPVPSPTPTPLAAATVPPVTYRVKPGDTLTGIADLFGVTVDDIVRSNNIADPNSLSVGQVLTIPGHSPAVTATTTATPRGGTAMPAGTATFQPPVLPPPDVTPPLGPTVSP